MPAALDSDASDAAAALRSAAEFLICRAPAMLAGSAFRRKRKRLELATATPNAEAFSPVTHRTLPVTETLRVVQNDFSDGCSASG